MARQRRGRWWHSWVSTDIPARRRRTGRQRHRRRMLPRTRCYRGRGRLGSEVRGPVRSRWLGAWRHDRWGGRRRGERRQGRRSGGPVGWEGRRYGRRPDVSSGLVLGEGRRAGRTPCDLSGCSGGTVAGACGVVAEPVEVAAPVTQLPPPAQREYGRRSCRRSVAAAPTAARGSRLGPSGTPTQ